MKNRTNGFILLITLCTILVISLLVLTFMQHVLLYHKAVNQHKEQQQKFYQLEHTVLHLAQSAMQQCIGHGDDANKIIEQVIQHEGCIFTADKIRYRYLIEDLGDFPCLILSQKEHQFSTRHSRITVATDTEDIPTSVMQVRYIKPVALMPCAGVRHVVSAGVSSWRYFDSVDLMTVGADLMALVGAE